MFLQKDPVWEITGAEFSKSTTHTADGISTRFPRVTRIRDNKYWEIGNDLPHLRVSYTGLIPGNIQDNCPNIGHFKIIYGMNWVGSVSNITVRRFGWGGRVGE